MEVKLVRTHDDFCLVDALSRQLIPISEYASMYGVKAGVIAEYCKDGRLQGAVSIYGRWFVPCDALYPLDERVRTAVQRAPLPEQLQRLYRCEPKRHAMPVPPAEELQALYDDCGSVEELAREYGVSSTTVSRWMKQAGCEMKCKVQMPPAKELRALYQAHTTVELAEKYGVSATTVSKWLKLAGCTIHKKALPMPPAEELQALCQDHSTAEIAEKYGVSATTVSKWLKHAGCEIRRKALQMPSAEELRALCQDHTAAEIAKMYGVSATTVGRWRKKSGC